MKYLKYSLVLIITCCLNTIVYAASQPEMATIINLSGKQRMLTQKMSKEILLIGKGINVGENEINLRKTADLFEKTLKGLMNGDSQLGLVKIDNPAIMTQLKKVEKLWWGFQRSITVVLKGTAPLHVLKAIAVQNMPLLIEMNKAVKMYEKAGDSNLSPTMAVTINLAGKQRMLTQKMTKELLLVANNIHTNDNKTALTKTVALFDRTLKGLLDGDQELGLNGTKDNSIRTQLTLINTLWTEYKPVLDEINVSQAALTQAAILNMPLLKEMNKAVMMYTKSVK
ncbi:MAG: type IV pili methyl-accepting chemotaxis transducer N-terminal domain-containing protein [Thiomargarita sp.]|nr:type IV pili methyl-accepting chemotaxis transducer N-terminal domain-containing protein [Thiomargarita sp.]